MLDATLTAQLKQYLELLREPIELAASLDDSPKSSELRTLLEQIAALSDKVTVTEETHQYTPSFLIRRTGTDVAVRFAGIPLGHEFTSLVLALLQVGGHPVKLEQETIDAIKALPPREFTTYMSLTCQNCPTVVQALNTMSVINPGIKHTTVEGSLFQDEIKANNILSVPAVFSEGELFASGRMDVAEFLELLDEGQAERVAASLTERAPYDVLVVGGGAAGATAAIYSGRKSFRTAVVAERFGGQMQDTMSIENFTSMVETTGPKLSAEMEQHVAAQEGVDIIKGVVAENIAKTDDGYFTLTTEGGGTLKGKNVILATGAQWRTTGVPGEDEYRNKGVTFCPHCDGPLFKGKPVAVIGGGNSGIEAAIDLAALASHVTVVEFLEDLKADEVLQKTLRSLPNVDVITQAQTKTIVGDGAQVTSLEYIDRGSGETKSINVNGVFVQIGLLPRTSWLGDFVALNERGEIVVDERGATNVPGVFAAGDCTNTPYKQIVVASGMGAKAALGLFDYTIRQERSA